MAQIQQDVWEMVEMSDDSEKQLSTAGTEGWLLPKILGRNGRVIIVHM